jgi:hypothetical protein
MVELQPFEGASNRSSIVILEKGKPTRYPVSYNLWFKKVSGRGIGTDFDLDEVSEIATYRKFYAEPVNESDPTSAWLTGKTKALKAIRKVLGKSDYEAHAGCYTGGANGVFWVDIIDKRPDGLVVVSNITEGAKREVENVQAAIEPDLLYPLLRGRDVKRWQATPSAHILMVQDPVKRQGISEDRMKSSYPRTYAYLKRFETVLRERKSRGVSDMLEAGAPFYTMFAVGDYTFAPYKVVWPNIASEIVSAVISTWEGKSILPQHIVTLVACRSLAEAHFICALMNSQVANFSLQSYSMTGGKSFGDPHVLQNIRVPRFDSTDKVHEELGYLSEQAHHAAAEGDQETVSSIEKRIDELAAELWGLTKEELKEIQESLAELSG